LVSFLIKKGADVDKKYPGKYSPLIFAVAAKNIAIASLLLENGADMNIKDKRETALHQACINLDKQMICLLIRKGADVNAKCNRDKTPFSFLNFHKIFSDECVTVVIKEFAKLIFQNLPVCEVNMDLMRK